jgi:hypothetical protein
MPISEIKAFLVDPFFLNWIAPLIMTGLTALIAKWLTPRSRVVWSNLHAFAFLVSRTPRGPDDDQSRTMIIYTQTVLIQNTGKATAEKIEIHFPFKPENFQLFPPVTYAEHRNPDGYFIIIIERLTKGELVMLELLQGVNELPSVMRVRSADHVGIEQAMHWQKVFGKPFSLFILLLLALGIFTLSRLVFVAIAAVYGMAITP